MICATPGVIIAGIGVTELCRDAGRSELALACEAMQAALADAGMTVADVDGLARVTQDRTTETMLASALGMDNLRYTGLVAHGGAPALVGQAAMAIRCGAADVVIAYRSLRRSGRSATSDERQPPDTTRDVERAHGLLAPVHRFALIARRHMIEHGSTSRQFGMVAVTQRRHAHRNPRAMMRGRTLTLEDHQRSRVICDPLRLHDCCVECDGAAAIVLARADRAADLPRRAVRLAGSAQATGRNPEGALYKPSLAVSDAEYAAHEVFRAAGVKPHDVDVAQLYDHFSPFVLYALETYGFCPRGAAGAFVEAGETAWPGGSLPVNKHGGNLSEGYLHCFTHVVEAVRQLRGEAACQVNDARVAFVGMAFAPTASALILTADPP